MKLGGVSLAALITVVALIATPADDASAIESGGGKFGLASISHPRCNYYERTTGRSAELIAPPPSARGVNINRRRPDRNRIRYMVSLVQERDDGQLVVTRVSNWSGWGFTREYRWTTWSGAPVIFSADGGSRSRLGYTFEWWRKKSKRRWQRVGWNMIIPEVYDLHQPPHRIGYFDVCTTPWGPTGPMPLPHPLVPEQPGPYPYL